MSRRRRTPRAGVPRSPAGLASTTGPGRSFAERALCAACAAASPKAVATVCLPETPSPACERASASRSRHSGRPCHRRRARGRDPVGVRAAARSCARATGHRRGYPHCRWNCPRRCSGPRTSAWRVGSASSWRCPLAPCGSTAAPAGAEPRARPGRHDEVRRRGIKGKVRPVDSGSPPARFGDVVATLRSEEGIFVGHSSGGPDNTTSEGISSFTAARLRP
jgi:hypothetical protein